MNLTRLKDTLVAKHAELTAIRWGVPYGYLKTIKSLKKIERLLVHIDSRLEKADILYIHPSVQKQINRAFRDWQRGKRFMAIDVERTEEGVLHEVGITMIQGRSIESFNYRVKGISRGPKFLFGSQIEADKEIIANLVVLHGEGADSFIAHDYRHDVEHIRAEGIDIPLRFCCDTSNWGRAILGYRPRLWDLCQKFNVGGSQMHCGGNDARYTGEIFLKMINMYHVES